MSREPADIFAKVDTAPSGARGRGGRLLLGAMGIFLAWALFVPLGSAVVAPATLAATGRNQLLQHVSGGSVTAILAREGDMVDKGGVVLELDPALDQARLTKLKGRHAVLKALRARLEAQKASYPDDGAEAGTVGELELRGSSGIDLMKTAALSDTPVERALGAEQIREYEKGRNEIAAQLRALTDRTDAQRRRAAELAVQIDNGEQRIGLIRSQLASAETLLRSGSIARQQVWELQARALEAESGLSELRAALAATEGAIGETEAEMERIRMSDGRETSRQLTDVIAEIEQISDELAAAEIARNQASLRAPVRGHLVHLATTTVGGVVRPGEVVGEIVPADAPLEARARVAPQQIAHVHVGQAAEVRVSALNPRTFDRLPAKVTYVAADASVDERTGERYFDVRALVDASELADSGITLQPGMNGEIYIEGEERTFATYLTQPFLDSLSLAFREVH